MTKPEGKTRAQEARQKRLKEALRRNLLRRKKPAAPAPASREILPKETT